MRPDLIALAACAAALRTPARVLSPSPPNARFAGTLAPSTLLGPGRVRIAVRGPVGAYAAIRDNTTVQLVLDPMMGFSDDAVTVSVWLRASGPAAPLAEVRAGERHLGEARPTSRFAPFRFPAATLRGRRVRLGFVSADATGLQLALPGTVQRAPGLHLALGRLRHLPHRRLLVVHAGSALAGQCVRVLAAGSKGPFRLLTSLSLARDATARALVRVPQGVCLLRLAYGGSERAAPGVSAPRRVR